MTEVSKIQNELNKINSNIQDLEKKFTATNEIIVSDLNKLVDRFEKIEEKIKTYSKK